MPLVSSAMTRTSSAAGAGMPASAMTRDQCSNPGVTCGVIGVVSCKAVWCGAMWWCRACGGAERVVVRSVWWCEAVWYRLAIQLGDEVREQQEPAYGEREWPERTGRLHNGHHHVLRGKDLREG